MFLSVYLELKPLSKSYIFKNKLRFELLLFDSTLYSYNLQVFIKLLTSKLNSPKPLKLLSKIRKFMEVQKSSHTGQYFHAGQYFEFHPPQDKKEVIVFKHGMGESGTTFNPMVDYFSSQGYGAIPLDTFGHGHSRYGYSMQGQADNLVSLLDRLRIDRIHSVGFSLGTIESLAFASAHPDRVNRMAFLSPGMYRNEFFTPLFRTILPAMNLAAKLGAKKLKMRGNRPDVFQFPKNIYGAFLFRLNATGPRGMLEVMEAIKEYGVPEEEHAQITAPTLIVQGEKDELFNGKVSDYLEATLKNTERVNLEGEGHVLIHPGLVDHLNTLVRDFFSRES